MLASYKLQDDEPGLDIRVDISIHATADSNVLSLKELKVEIGMILKVEKGQEEGG